MWPKLIGGIALVLVGLVVAFFTFGPALLADCSNACKANHEREIAIGVGVVGLAVSVGGVLLTRDGIRKRRAG
ncbi:MAG: hypothetical protein ACYDCK_09175 [Thermoplasmatota archaeon]